jgi:hypothetical protein
MKQQKSDSEYYLDDTNRLCKNLEVMLGRKLELFEVPIAFFAYSQGRIDETNQRLFKKVIDKLPEKKS